MNSKVKNLEINILRFSKTQDPADLQLALSELQEASSAPSDKPIESVPSLTSEWLRFFLAIDQVIDKLKTTVTPPLLHVMPPSDNNGNLSGYAPGVDPESIKDPELKKRYKAAIAENDKRLAAWNRYQEICTIERHSTGDFFAWAGSRYRNNSEARKQLLREATKLKLNTERMTKIHEAVD
ncbi:hypothetical protein [Terracidiphilus sp.]|uniref:hypothetical protein n=1 Tax=Terracidiphilus sp. TaxID=1964191 RepID=UPI003C21EFC5